MQPILLIYKLQGIVLSHQISNYIFNYMYIIVSVVFEYFMYISSGDEVGYQFIQDVLCKHTTGDLYTTAYSEQSSYTPC